MNHAKNGTVETSIGNSIFDPIFIRFLAGCLVKGNPRVTSAYVVISSALENRVKIGVAETSQVYLKLKCT